MPCAYPFFIPNRNGGILFGLWANHFTFSSGLNYLTLKVWLPTFTTYTERPGSVR